MLEKTLTDKLCKCRNKKKNMYFDYINNIHSLYLFIYYLKFSEFAIKLNWQKKIDDK